MLLLQGNTLASGEVLSPQRTENNHHVSISCSFFCSIWFLPFDFKAIFEDEIFKFCFFLEEIKPNRT